MSDNKYAQHHLSAHRAAKKKVTVDCSVARLLKQADNRSLVIGKLAIVTVFGIVCYLLPLNA